jgi:hypothetical protein
MRMARRRRFYTDMLLSVCLCVYIGNGAALASPAGD